jgi:hypothetical protein
MDWWSHRASEGAGRKEQAGTSSSGQEQLHHSAFREGFMYSRHMIKRDRHVPDGKNRPFH